MSSHASDAAGSCPNCGQPLTDVYCSRCGEKRPERTDWKLQNIAGEAFAEITNLEHSKLWRTLRLLVFKPGQLTREFWSGRRKASLGPVKLYLVFFAVSLVLYSIHQPTAVYDAARLASLDPGGTLATSLQRVASERGVPAPLLMQDVSSRWQSYISMSQLLYPLFVALALKLLYAKRGRFFAEHLIFALHVLAFLSLTTVVFWPLYFLFGPGGEDEIHNFTTVYFVLTAASTVWTLAYLLLAVRRAYEERWFPALVKSALVFAVYFATATLFIAAALLFAISRAQVAG